MKTVLPTSLTTIQEAENFLQSLYDNGEAFHPDDNPRSLVGISFTEEEAAVLENLMYEAVHIKDFDPYLFLLTRDPDYNTDEDETPTPTFEAFVSSRKQIADKKDIAMFFFALFGDPDFKKDESVVGIKSLYVYAGDYWLTENVDGNFSALIESGEPTGTFSEIEGILYKYAYVND